MLNDKKKLKTLKDLRWLDVIDGDIVTSTRCLPLSHHRNTDMIYINDIRAAAREWLEEYERLDEIAKKEINASIHWGVIIFIKYFFNLDEKE